MLLSLSLRSRHHLCWSLLGSGLDDGGTQELGEVDELLMEPQRGLARRPGQAVWNVRS